MPIEKVQSLSSQPSRTFIFIQRESVRNSVQFEQELRKHAVHHVATETMKSLHFIKRSDFISARDSVTIPLGLFGLSLENFYARRKQNIVYLDVLKLTPRETLDQAKLCIVIDDIQNYLKALFDGYEKHTFVVVVNDIRDSQKLLTIHERIADDFRNNSEMQKRLLSKLGAFNVRERQALMYVQSQLYNAQNNFAESQLVVEPIEYRYRLKYHEETTKQSAEEMAQREQKLKEPIERIVWKHSREVAASDAIQTKLLDDIATYRRRLNDMLLEYTTAYDSLDSKITYKINAMGVMKEQRRECEAKMEFFAANKFKLVEWLKEWEWKKHQSEGKVRRKKGKNKPHKGRTNE